jgi:PAS domain S-box-containing protein
MVEDSEDDALLEIRELKKGGYNPVYERVETAAAMKKALQENQWDIILCDYKMPNFYAPSAIAILKEANIDIPLIIVSGTIGEDVAVECMLLGAHDYIMKGNLSRLCPAIARELKDAEVKNKQKDTEEKLRHEEQRFRAFVEHSSDIIVLLNLEGIITYINPAVERVLGFKPEERIGAKGFELVHPDDIKFLADSFNTLARDTHSSVIQGEMHLRHKDGSWRTLEAVGSNLVHNNVGEAIIVNYRDITERKRMEEALRISEERFKSIVTTSQEWIWAIDTNGIYTFSNPAIENILGYTSDEIVMSSSRKNLILEEDIPRVRELFAQSIEQKKGWSDVVLRWVHKDGTYRYLESNAVPIFDKAGILKGFQGSDRDITQRKNAEEKLRENERQYRLLTEKMSDIVWITDMNLRTIYISPSIKNVLGFSQEERMRQKLDEQLTPQSLSLVLEALSRELALEEQGNTDPNRTLTIELEYYHKDGSTRWMELVISGLRNDQGVLTRIHGVSRDITDRKRAEKELRESEEKYRLIFEYSPLGLLSFDEKGVIINCNDNFVKIIGSSREKLIGLNMLNLPDKKMVSTIQKALNGSTGLYEGLYSSVTSKKITPTRAIFASMDVGGGRIPGGVGIIEDITERKQAEEALREGEELYRTIFENTGTSMILIEEDMTISMSNGEFVRNTGYSTDEINGRMKWTEIIHPDDLERMVEQHRLRRESQGRALPSYEFRYITKKGDLRDTLLTIKLVPGTKKSIASLIDITKRKQAEEKLQQTLESLRKAVGTTIQVLVSALESRDPYTSGHQSRSADLACVIATEMGLVQDKIEGIRMAGIIHDIGKLSIPVEILSKPTKLTEIEFSLIKEHSRSGYEMLKNVESPWPLAEIVYQHHERMNGSGYPRNLKVDEILMESRILAVADVVEAMASHRPYRPTLGIEAALEEIEKNKGILYDDAVADACLRLFREKGYQLT